MKRTILVLALLVLSAPMVPAQIGGARPAASTSPAAPQADRRAKTVLDELGYRYEMTADADFKLIPIRTGDGDRTQLVYVNSNTETYGDLEIREVLAPAFLSNGPLSAAVANKLLRENNTVKFGAWRVVPITSGQNAGKYLAMFVAQIAATSDAETMRLAIKSVILISDRMEKELTGTDDY